MVSAAHRAAVVLTTALACSWAMAGYTPVEWIQGGGASQKPWLDLRFRPSGYDKFSMKVNLANANDIQCFWCSRGATTTENTYTAFLIGGKLRVDHGSATGPSTSASLATGTDYTIFADGAGKSAKFSDGTATASITLADAAFTAGSRLTLFASHTAGTNLTEQTEVGNVGSYRLYSFKIYDGISGALLRDYVPVKDMSTEVTGRKVGLFEKLTRTFVPNSGTGEFAAGEPTGEADLSEETADEQYVVDVPGNESLALSAEHVAAATGKTLVKTGSGTLFVGGDVMKDFPGDIRVRGGFYVIQSTNSLGTAAGQTHVEPGATLINQVGGGATDGSKPLFPKEVIHLSGNGCGGWGALQNKAGTVDFCRNVILDGDTRIHADQRLDLRGATFDMNGYNLETYGEFLLVIANVRREGNFTVRTGDFEYQTSISSVVPTVYHTFCSGARLRLFGLTSWIPGKFLFEPDTSIYSQNGTFKFAETDNRNIINGLVTLQGPVKLNLISKSQVQLRNRVTGPGGFVGGKEGYLQLFYNNDFKGGIDFTGALLSDGQPYGGIVAYANGAIPNADDAAPCSLSNAVLYLRYVSAFKLPAIRLSGTSIVSNQDCVASVTSPSFTKSGDGVSRIFGSFSVTGDAEIAGGTLVLSPVPEAIPGMLWSYSNQQSGPTSVTDQGLDCTGVAYAYKSWPYGTEIKFSYTGYIRVPGEPGESVTCNWMTSTARGCKVTIGGVVCCDFNDNKNTKDDITVGYARLAMYKPVTLTAGWQPITVTMNNWWNETRGPQDNTSLGWPGNFGIGVDWQARCVTNSAYYAKLLDPGDGSFIRPGSEEQTAELRRTYAARYRPTFSGGLGFGAGGTLDLGDPDKSVPMNVAKLAGLPTVKNGSLVVGSSTWTLRKSDLLDAGNKAQGKPMALGENGAITFPAGVVTIDVGEADAVALAHVHKTRNCPIVADANDFPNNAFVLSERLKATGWVLQRKGDALYLCSVAGLRVFIR